MRIIQFLKPDSQINPIYFPRSEFHCRFPGFHCMEHWSTYHRSSFKKLKDVSTKKFTFTGNQKKDSPGMFSKTGNYHNPFAFNNYQSELKSTKMRVNPESPAVWYDRLLTTQKNLARYALDQVLSRDPNFMINADNSYPCVLFSLPKPKAEKNPSIWSETLLVYLIALTNKLALERGINIEMVRRSSFGSLRPSVAECGESVRINLGLSPKVYVDCVVDALFYLKKLFANSQFFEIPMNSKALSNSLNAYNIEKSTDKKTVSIQLKNNLWNTLWAAGDSSKKSFATQIFRKAVVVEYLIDLILDACLDNTLEELFNNTQSIKRAFALPLKKILLAIQLKGNSLSINVSRDLLKSYQWKEAQIIDDQGYWLLIEELAQRLRVPKTEIRKVLKTQTTEDLHSRFEAYVANFTFMPHYYKNLEDGYGSDSDEEADLPIHESTQKVYAKKLITATGMRAIQLIYAVSRQYLYDQYQVDPLHLTFTAQQMYYETHEGLCKFAIPFDPPCENRNNRGKQQNISFFDINHCNTTHEKMRTILRYIEKKDKVCAIDITSATSQEVHDTLVNIFEKRPEMEAILTISSGLKNEQFMSDYNPYGTIRIFTKDKNSLDKIYHDLIKLEVEAEYKHPKESHQIRKTAKEVGGTLTNGVILNG